MTDPIADYLTRIRNAVNAGHKIVEIPASRVKTELTRILHEKGYILSYKIEEGKPPTPLKSPLNTIPRQNVRPLKSSSAFPVPVCAVIPMWIKCPACSMAWVLPSYSHPKGIITDKEAKTLNVGGEIMCYVY